MGRVGLRAIGGGWPRSRRGCETWDFPILLLHGRPSQTGHRASPMLPFVSSHPERYYGSGDLHFITATCYHRQPFLDTPARRDLFLHVLEHMRRRYRFVVLGYVIMPEHFHLLVSEPQSKTLSTVMRALKLGFSRRWLSPGRALQRPTQRLAPRRICKPASTTSTSGLNANALRNCATCIAIQ